MARLWTDSYGFIILPSIVTERNTKGILEILNNDFLKYLLGNDFLVAMGHDYYNRLSQLYILEVQN